MTPTSSVAKWQKEVLCLYVPRTELMMTELHREREHSLVVHTSPNTGAILCRVQTLLRLLRWIDLGCLWRSTGAVRGHHHGRRTDQAHGGSCARSHHERTALVIERDHLECECRTSGQRRERTIYTVIRCRFMYT